jgi:hypothetical protein
LFDQFIAGPDRLEGALHLLLDRRAAGSDPDDAALLSAIIDRLDQERRREPR